MSLSYTLRISKELRGLLEIAARKEEVSLASLIVRACWKLLDEFGDGGVAQRPEQGTSKPTVEGSSPYPASISQLRQTIAAIESKPVESMQAEIPMCHKTWWEDGEQYECLMDTGHKEQKHGMRGMVRRLDV